MEAIKGAVQAGLGAAFVSVLAIEKELSLGLVARVRIDGVTLPRTLWLVNDPLRSLTQVQRWSVLGAALSGVQTVPAGGVVVDRL